MIARTTLLIVLAATSLIGIARAEEKKDKLLRVPGAVLWQGFPGYDEFVTTPKSEISLPKTGLVFSDLSRDGTSIAAAICKSDCKIGSKDRQELVGSYQLDTKKWTEYGETMNAGALSLSPDRGMLAFVSGETLHLLKISDGTDSVLVTAVSRVKPTWSPDGNRLAYQVDLPPPTHSGHHGSEIFVVDVTTRKTTKVSSDGQNPAWSPSGEWIAFFDTSGDPGREKCKLVRPNGADEHLLLEAPKSYWGERGFFGVKGDFWLQPVWSPDSKRLLLNVYWDWETLKTDIYEFQITGQQKPIRRIHYGYPVLGWAEIKQ